MLPMLRPRTILLANRLLPPIHMPHIRHIGLARRGCSAAWRVQSLAFAASRAPIVDRPSAAFAFGIMPAAGLLSLGSCASTAGHRDDRARVAVLGTGAALSRADKARK